jgi:hypothetical protein
VFPHVNPIFVTNDNEAKALSKKYIEKTERDMKLTVFSNPMTKNDATIW